DLEVHLKFRHGMADTQTEVAMAEKEQLEDGNLETGSGNERGQDENDGNSGMGNQDVQYEDEDVDFGIGFGDEWAEDEDVGLDFWPELEWSPESAAERGVEFWLAGES